MDTIAATSEQPDGTPPVALARAVAEVERFLSASPTGLPDADLLAASRTLQGLTSMVQAADLRIVHEIDTRGTTDALAGCPTNAWLRESNRVTARQANGAVRSAADLAGHPHVGAALARGNASPEQCRGLLTGLSELPEDLPADIADAVERFLVGCLDRFDPDELRRLAAHALEVVAPEIAEEALRRALEQQHARAQRRRRLTWARDGHGSVFFRVKLPTLEAEELITQLDAYVDRARRLDEADAEGADPAYVPPTLDQRRADALMSIVRACCSEARAPFHGGDRPRITVIAWADDLRQRLGIGVLADSGEPISAGELRHLACDADLLPVVLGGPSQLLDVGRTMRLVSGDLRQAVHLRDGGCAFPGCDHRPRHCEVHHIIPWAQGGATALPNLVLLCRHHHALVEPDPRSEPGSRWEVQMGPDGIPEVLPPQRRGSERAPRRHARYAMRGPSG
ncbi:HNH endonuclease [Raineyella antarctica]|uniref:HNH endonuclease n=1 Tax=Raineyella antarctica TaxID=1577474 RepID=A0A1G6I3I0_9ACTN|nr:HNH endonuclease signature motif containing protein [Raineyella antarctica]SDC01044.1 HNH endonuclease [Raineyella antarctica]